MSNSENNSIALPLNGLEDKKLKRRKLGRAARRRRNKVRAIRQSVKNLLSGNISSTKHQDTNSENVDENISCLPTDRSNSLPGVITRRKQFNHQKDDFFMNGLNGMNKDDETMLTSQLGFIPGNAISVVARVKNIEMLYPRLFKLLSSYEFDNTIIDAASKEQNLNHPLVLQLYPLVTRDVYNGGKSDGRKFKSRKRGYSHIDPNDNPCTDEQSDLDEENLNSPVNDSLSSSSLTIEPFPTMYWLTHPHLRTLISQLEIEPKHNVKTVEDKLSSSTDNLIAMSKAHESYGKARWQLLTDEDRIETKNRNWSDALGIKRGVAGIRNFEAVKCLHAHAAHYLAQCEINRMDQIDSQDLPENLVGRWVLEAVEELILNDGNF